MLAPDHEDVLGARVIATDRVRCGREAENGGLALIQRRRLRGAIDDQGNASLGRPLEIEREGDAVRISAVVDQRQRPIEHLDAEVLA